MRLPPSPPAWSLQSKAPCRVCGPVESEVHWSSPRPSLGSDEEGGASDPEHEKHVDMKKTLKHHFEYWISKTKLKDVNNKKWKSLKDTTVMYSVQSNYASTHPFSILCLLLFSQHKRALELAYSSNLRPSNLHRGVNLEIKDLVPIKIEGSTSILHQTHGN